ncbi:MAG: hypothetical protein ABFS24_05185 [Pseudomonadota bacterium]
MAAHKLILLPTDPACPPVNTDRLAVKLQAIGLIGLPREVNNGRFYPTGEHFLQLVTFLGCSPMIELGPPSDPEILAADSAAGKFCHVFLSSFETLRFRSDPRSPAPRCPACHTPLTDWPSLLQAWQSNLANGDWRCAHCEHTGHISGLVFRKSAGFGRTFVEIRGIYPSEAVPGDALLNSLKSLTHGDWSTLYIKE